MSAARRAARRHRPTRPAGGPRWRVSPSPTTDLLRRFGKNRRCPGDQPIRLCPSAAERSVKPRTGDPPRCTLQGGGTGYERYDTDHMAHGGRAGRRACHDHASRLPEPAAPHSPGRAGRPARPSCVWGHALRIAHGPGVVPRCGRHLPPHAGGYAGPTRSAGPAHAGPPCAVACRARPRCPERGGSSRRYSANGPSRPLARRAPVIAPGVFIVTRPGCPTSRFVHARSITVGCRATTSGIVPQASEMCRRPCGRCTGWSRRVYGQ